MFPGGDLKREYKEEIPLLLLMIIRFTQTVNQSSRKWLARKKIFLFLGNSEIKPSVFAVGLWNALIWNINFSNTTLNPDRV